MDLSGALCIITGTPEVSAGLLAKSNAKAPQANSPFNKQTSKAGFKGHTQGLQLCFKDTSHTPFLPLTIWFLHANICGEERIKPPSELLKCRFLRGS